MSKKTYLLLALLCVGLALYVAPAFAATQVVKSWDIGAENPGWTLEGDWAYGTPLGEGGDSSGNGADPGSSVGNVLGTNLEGNYSADAAEYATSDEADCSGMVGTTLSFHYWLDVQSNKFDQATVEVSADGGDWVVVWENPGEADLLMDAFDTTTVDISAIADGAGAVQVRFGLVSDGSIEFGGWNINLVTINATADNTTAYNWLLPTSTAVLATDWTGVAGNPGWSVGPPVVGTSGQLDTTTSEMIGVDPAEDAEGATTDDILGYNIGGNYQHAMAAAYATSPVLDFSLSRSVKLTFAKWLAVEGSASDHAAIQINSDGLVPEELFASDFSADTIADYTVTGNGDASVNTSAGVIDTDGPVSVAIAIDTTEHYDLAGTVSLATTFTGGSAQIQFTDGDIVGGELVWTNLGAAITGDTSMTDIPFTIPVQTASTDPKGEDNASFQLRVNITGLIGTDTAQIGGIVLNGVKWAYLYQNPAANLFDTAWTSESIDLSGDADGNDAVQVRFVMGPSDSFGAVGSSEYGGWSVDDIAFTEGTLSWKSVEDTYESPAAMFWGQDTESVAMTLKNMGTGYWSDDFSVAEVAGPADELGVGTSTALTETDMIQRYGVGDFTIGDTVDSGATIDLSADLVAPPVTTLAYAADATPTDPGDASTSVTGVNWYLFDSDGAAVTLYDDQDDNNPDVPKGLVQISRFPDVQLNASEDGAYWARYWIEQLAGRVPMVVAGLKVGSAPAIYLPENAVSRGALAVYIQRAMSLPLSDPPAFIFKDVPVEGEGDPPATTTYWAAAQIEAVFNAGIIQGIPPDFTTFAPDNNVDRQGMAKFIANGAQLPGYLDSADTVAADWAAMDEPPFADVALEVPSSTPGVAKANPFLPFINACLNANVVQGIVPPPGGAYAPTDTVTRSQLAVFVWRAFMRNQSTPVVLAGPAITDAEISPAATPSGVIGQTSWIGFPEVNTADNWDNSNVLYVALDAVRLGAAAPVAPVSNNFAVKFELRKSSEATAAAERTLVLPLTDAEIATAAADALTNVNPYLTFYQLVPAGTPSAANADMTGGAGDPLADPMHGDFTFVASITIPSTSSEVKWSEIARQPGYRSYGRFFFTDFETGLTIVPVSTGVLGWKVSGLPSTGIRLVSDVATNNGSVQVAKLVQTQTMSRHINTTGWHNVNVSFSIGASNLSASDSFVVEYSTDGGTNWNELVALSDVGATDAGDIALEDMDFDLPSAASMNPNFWLRVKMNGAGTDNIGYIDAIQLKGT